LDAEKKLDFINGFDGLLAGADEAGRGPLAGPVVGAAVILTPPQREALLKLGLRDSKRMSPERREALFRDMLEMGVLWRAQAASVAAIAEMNILRASLWAMGKSVKKLPPVDLVVVDGLHVLPGISARQMPLVRADDLVPSVSAASVVAKVLRDRVMIALDRVYPQYGFAQHKGYPTKAHREAVRAFGLSPAHRALFCKKLIMENAERRE
jgi:ribonuclease HII